MNKPPLKDYLKQHAATITYPLGFFLILMLLEKSLRTPETISFFLMIFLFILYGLYIDYTHQK